VQFKFKKFRLKITQGWPNDMRYQVIGGEKRSPVLHRNQQWPDILWWKLAKLPFPALNPWTWTPLFT
jgi:hypothetical protein